MLALSSWVAAGHVGLSAATPALQALGVEVIGLPTVTLSNHRAFAHVAGEVTPPDRLRAMLDAVAANGWLAGLDAVLTGYLPTPAHVDVAVAAAQAARAASPGVRVVCDPVMGDDPRGLYLPAETADAIGARLAPLADALTPNRFELSRLTGAPADTLQACADAALRLAGAGRRVIVTSPPSPPDRTGALEAAGGAARLYPTARVDGAPHGTGDVFAALVAAGLATGEATGLIARLVGRSAGRAHLAMAGFDWTAPPVAPVTLADSPPA